MGKTFVLVALMLVMVLFLVGVSAGTWCDNDFAKRINVSVNNTGGSALTDYQVYVNLSVNPINETSLRVYNATSCTLRSHWSENTTAGNSYGIWINYSAIAATSWTNNTAIYHNNVAVSSTSNGIATFDFFDDFSDGTYEGDSEDGIVSNFGDWSRNRASYIVGDFAYCTENTGMHVINISDPENPVEEGNITLGTSSSQVLDIEVRGNYAYIGILGDDELEIVNISDHTNLRAVGNVTDATKLDQIHGINLSGDYVYCCAYSSGVGGYFTLVNVSDPTNPTIEGSIANNASNYIKGSHDAQVIGNYAYLAASNHNADNDGRVTIINISNKSSPFVVSSLTGSEIHRIADIQVKGDYAFVGQFGYPPGAPANRYFRVINISNVSNPFLAGGLAGYNMYIGDIHGDLIYCADNRHDYVTVINISIPTSPVFVKQYTIPNSTSHAVLHVFLTADGSHAVVARYDDPPDTRPYYIINTSAILIQEDDWVVTDSDTGDVISASSYYLNLARGGADGALYVKHSIPSCNDLIMEYDWNCTATGNGPSFWLANGDLLTDRGPNTFFNLGTNKLRYYAGAYYNLANITGDTWYHIKVVAHTGTDTFDIYAYHMNGTELSYDISNTGLNFRNVLSNINRTFIGAYNANDIVRTDNYFVRKYASPEPSIALGSEEQQEGGTTPSISNVVNDSISSTSQYINWTVNQTAHNRVLYSNESDLTPAWYSTWDNSTNAPNITISGLDASTQYWYQAWSYNITNTSLSNNSSTLDFTTVDGLIWIVGYGGENWNGNVAYNGTVEVQATGYIELQQEVNDYYTYHRYDNNIIVDENTTTSCNATNYGASYNATGKYGGAYDFDDIADYMALDDGAVWTWTPVAQNRTLSLWFRPTVQPTNDGHPFQILKTATTPGNNYQFLYYQTEGVYYLFCRVSDNAHVSLGYFYCVKTLSLNTWYHVVIMPSSAGNNKVYVDGVSQSVGENSWDDNTEINPTATTIRSPIGENTGEAVVDDFRWFYRALSNSEINKTRDNEHYTSGNLSAKLLDAENITGGSSGCLFKNVSIEGVNASGTWFHGYWNYSADNSSFAIEDLGNFTTGTAITLGNQTRYGSVIVEFDTNDATKTPVLHNVTLYITEGGGDTAPNISSPYPPSIVVNTTVETSVTFGATINQSASNQWIGNFGSGNTTLEWDNATSFPTYTNTTFNQTGGCWGDEFIAEDAYWNWAYNKGTGYKQITTVDGISAVEIGITDQTTAEVYSDGSLHNSTHQYNYGTFETRLRYADNYEMGTMGWGFWNNEVGGEGECAWFWNASSQGDASEFQAMVSDDGKIIFNQTLPEIDIKEWHTYKIELLANGTRFSIDGNEVASTSKRPSNLQRLSLWIDNSLMNVDANNNLTKIGNISVGQDQKMYVDWVTYYDNYFIYLKAHNALDNSLNTSTSWIWNILDGAPPASITSLTNSSYALSYINWTWTNPTDVDFNYTKIYIDNVFETNAHTGFYNDTGLLSYAEYNISTHTVDTFGNINTTWINASATTSAANVSTLHIYNGINIKDDWGRDFNSNLSANVTVANASDVWMNFTNVEFTNTSLGWVNLTLDEWVNESHNVNVPVSNISVDVTLNSTTSGATNDTDSFYYEVTNRTNTGTMDSAATQNANTSETFYVNATCNEEYGDTFYGAANLLEDGAIVATNSSITNYVNFSHSESSAGVYNYTVRFYNLTHYDNATTPTYSNVTITNQPPAPPQNLTNLSYAATYVELDWDDNTEGDLDGYEVFRNTSLALTITPPVSEGNDTGLPPSTYYCYKVRAYDDAGGRSGNSSEICVWTAASPPGDYIPPNPINLANTTGNFWVNHTWSMGTPGNITDSYNVSIGAAWHNTTTVTYHNDTGLSAHDWSNVTVWAYNTTGSGSLSTGSASDDVRIPNNVPVLSGLPDNTTDEDVNQTDIFDLDDYYSDADSDTPTYLVETNNQSAYISVIINASNNVSYTLASGWNGTAEVVINVTDGWGGEDNDTFLIFVNAPPPPGDYIPPDPTNLQNTSGNYWVNYTWSAGTPGNITDLFNISWNLSWYNDTSVTFMNDTIPTGCWANISVYAFNSSGNGTLSTGYVSDEVKVSDAPSDYIPPDPTNLTNTTGNGWVNYTWDTGTPGNITDSYNVSWNLTWHNITLVTYMNDSVGEFGWANISVWAYNSSGNGSLSAGNVSDETQAGGGTYITTMTTGVYNLITYYGATNSTAEEFGIDIGNVDYVAKYNGSFYTHTMGFAANNFTTYHGIGYYVYLNASGTSTYQRNNISDTPYNTQLFNRWNTIGWTNTTDTNAEGVATSVGSACKYTSSLNADGVTYTTHTVGFTSNNHAVEKGEGYWVWVDTGVSWGRNS